jgi:hypothetical protein
MLGRLHCSLTWLKRILLLLHGQVYTSSASVVFSGKPLHLVDEDTPYAATPMDFYTKTKVTTVPPHLKQLSLHQLQHTPNFAE